LLEACVSFLFTQIDFAIYATTIKNPKATKGFILSRSPPTTALILLILAQSWGVNDFELS
jgi:hypothetical protein